MARFKNKNRKRFVKPPVVKKQPNVDQVTGDKIPKSFVFSRGKIPGPLKQLELDIRKIMLPYTAIKLKEKKRNNLKDFLNVAGPMGVTHFLILSNPKSVPHLRVARTPQGPTLTFEIREYALAADIARSQIRPRCPKDLFNNSPLVVLSGFGGGGQHLKLTTIMFQNIFPAIDINTVKLSSCQRIVLLNYNSDSKLIDFRHYSIRLQPIGVSRKIRKFVQNHQVPDLRNLQDVSDFITKAGYGSESEVDEEAATVSLTSDVGRVNRASSKSAVKLQEIGPRMALQLVKIEEGLCSGGVIFSEYGLKKSVSACERSHATAVLNIYAPYMRCTKELTISTTNSRVLCDILNICDGDLEKGRGDCDFDCRMASFVEKEEKKRGRRKKEENLVYDEQPPKLLFHHLNFCFIQKEKIKLL